MAITNSNSISVNPDRVGFKLSWKLEFIESHKGYELPGNETAQSNDWFTRTLSQDVRWRN